jgi:outer membrane receptor protein involved in Fe transport
MWTSVVFSQQIIKGTVTNSETGNPIENANVLVLGTMDGSATDANGVFQISTSLTPPFTLLVSHIGYSPRHTEVTSEKELVLQLVPTPVLGADVSVVGTRSRADRDVSISFESITEEEIERSGALDLSDALRTISSVVIDQAEGGVQTVSIRGSNPNEVSVFLDGIRLNDANTGVANLAAIDRNDLSKIEVVKGGGTTLFGPGAFGGVLNLTTQTPDSTSLKISRGMGMLDDENQDLSASAAGRLGPLAIGGRYSGKARRYYGRSLYTTIFQNLFTSLHLRPGVFNLKGYALEDFLKYPTGDVLQSAKTQMAMAHYSGSIIAPGDWDLFAGQRKWSWHDEFFTNLNRDIEDRSFTSRVGYHFTSAQFDATAQIEYENQDYTGDNRYSEEIGNSGFFFQTSDIGKLKRDIYSISLVTRGISYVQNAAIQQIQWELGTRWDNTTTIHDQTISDITYGTPEILSVIDSTYKEQEFSFKVGVQVKGRQKGMNYSAYINQGRSKRLPSLNDYYLLSQVLTQNRGDLPLLTTEALSSTEIGVEFGYDRILSSPQIDELVVSGAVFSNNFTDKIAYNYNVFDDSGNQQPPIPFNTDLAKISGIELGFRTSWWQGSFRFQASYQKINLDNPIIFPNKPESRFTMHAEAGYKWLFLGYDQFREGTQFIVYNGFVGQSFQGRESANLTMILRWKLWKLKTSLHYVIYNLYSDEPVLADPEQHSITPFEYFGVHREILSLKIEL